VRTLLPAGDETRAKSVKSTDSNPGDYLDQVKPDHRVFTVGAKRRHLVEYFRINIYPVTGHASRATR
jgi:hypothetical protein